MSEPAHTVDASPLGTMYLHVELESWRLRLGNILTTCPLLTPDPIDLKVISSTAFPKSKNWKSVPMNTRSILPVNRQIEKLLKSCPFYSLFYLRLRKLMPVDVYEHFHLATICPIFGQGSHK